MSNDDDEIYITDRKEELIELAKKEQNPIRQNFSAIKENAAKIKCLMLILQKALDNEFNTPETNEVLNYTELVLEKIEEHNELLDEFLDNIEHPNKKSKLISLKFKD